MGTCPDVVNPVLVKLDVGRYPVTDYTFGETPPGMTQFDELGHQAVFDKN